jgi:hypothetical protein
VNFLGAIAQNGTTKLARWNPDFVLLNELKQNHASIKKCGKNILGQFLQTKALTSYKLN